VSQQRPVARASSTGGRSCTEITWAGAITVSQWQMFSSWRTLPGKLNCPGAPAPRRNALGLHPSCGALLQKVARQHGHVFAALAQRRQAQADHVQAVEQVLAEHAVLDALLQVLVGGGNHAHMALTAVAAHAVELPVRQHAQQAGLQVERHVADFVEEQRAALGLLEAAAALRLRAGEGAALMAEQFGLQQVLGMAAVLMATTGRWPRANACAARAPPAPCPSPIRR
jgi:hypothetical protein